MGTTSEVEGLGYFSLKAKSPKTLYIAACCYLLLLVIACCCLLLLVIACCHLLLLVVVVLLFCLLLLLLLLFVIVVCLLSSSLSFLLKLLVKYMCEHDAGGGEGIGYCSLKAKSPKSCLVACVFV